MDSMIFAAARALAAGDPFGALNRVALREDAAALALRGIAMAQLGDLERARALLRRAAKAFGPREAVARARCVVAEAEIALVMRDLGWRVDALEAAQATLAHHGDMVNAAHARHLAARRFLLTGQLEAAERAIADLDVSLLPPASRAAFELVVAGIAIRRLRTRPARDALARAWSAAKIAGIAALQAEVERASRALEEPAARLVKNGVERPLLLQEVEAIIASDVLVVDACRNAIRHSGASIALATRPVLFALARALGEAWPNDVTRDALLTRAFGAKSIDDSHRARLRVEIGRLRAALREVADICATKRGFALVPERGREVVVLVRPMDEEHAALLALLDDSEGWSTSALALALGASQRTMQRALEELAREGKVQAFGRGRARRWIMPPVSGFTTALLLPSALPTE
jgi:DNA-binding winged helix-turn-helix (wHTH) protein